MNKEIRKDIRIDKKKLRNIFKNTRDKMIDKSKIDNQIFNKLISTWAYREAKIILTYVSTNIEVDTIELINHSLKNNKKVAVPYCIENTRYMKFYFINSIDELEKRTFGVLEPIANKENELKDFSNSICIVPALAFDKNGYRLGYGKGYYDRFLSSYTSKTIGLCYESCICNQLPTGKFDKKVDTLITNKNTYNFN